MAHFGFARIGDRPGPRSQGAMAAIDGQIAVDAMAIPDSVSFGACCHLSIALLQAAGAGPFCAATNAGCLAWSRAAQHGDEDIPGQLWPRCSPVPDACIEVYFDARQRLRGDPARP